MPWRWIAGRRESSRAQAAESIYALDTHFVSVILNSLSTAHAFSFSAFRVCGCATPGPGGALVGRASLFTLRHVPFVEFFKAIFYVHAFAYICNSRTKFAAIDSLANGSVIYFPCLGT